MDATSVIVGFVAGWIMSVLAMRAALARVGKDIQKIAAEMRGDR